MATSTLATKLYIPPLRNRRVDRPRLTARLNAGPLRPPGVTLVAAPAGFGKTTIVSEWVAAARLPTAWLSLDEADNDLARFLTYLAAALQSVAPDIGAGVAELLRTSSPHPALAEAILTALLNELALQPDGAAAGSDFVLVLDDYHVINATSVDAAMTFLIDHMPPQMHLVITTREDPPFPLARLRARGQLTELRAADLRFTPAEAAEFLNEVMGLGIAAADVAALEARTEGWIAGLQLAALSMQNRRDAHGFVAAFAGDNRYIVDYLVEEVLQRQPEATRDFLLQTAILDRLSGPLCDAVTGRQEGRAQLEALERGNFFVVPLDDRRHWYRYHHLFAEVLMVHLMADLPEQVAMLHRRASAWYEQNGSEADAIHHALAAEDFARAAGLIELAIPAMRQGRQEVTLLGWMKALPEAVFHVRPVLSVGYVGAALSNGEPGGLEARLDDAERWLAATEGGRARPEEMVVVDEAEFRRLPGAIAMYRAGLALFMGNVPDTVTFARQVLDCTPESDHLLRGAAAAMLGLADWAVGDLDGAYEAYADGMASLQAAGNIADVVNGAITLAAIRIAQGHLREAMHIYEEALRLATEQGGPVLARRGAVDLYCGMSELYYERDDLPTALHLLQKSQELGEYNGLRENRFRWRVAMARIRQAQGDLVGALDLLHEAEQMYMIDFSPDVRPIKALTARVRIAQGKLDAASRWAREEGLSAGDTLSYGREFEHLTLARLLLAHYRRDRIDNQLREATDLLDRLLHAAEAGCRVGSTLEILVVQALAGQIRGDLPAALAALERALSLAEPEGHVRIFLDEGTEMMQLLREAAARKIMPGYTGRLLSGFSAEAQDVGRETPAAATSPSSPLIEPLSQRELEILRLFKTDLSGPEIAGELVIALSTVRTHTKSIYGKLGVDNRRAAVRRAEELRLI